MSCYHPISAYRNTRTGEIRFSLPTGGLAWTLYDCLMLPCGKCIGCRLEHSRKWAMRCVYEASQYDNNCFVTLTYDNEHLPKNGSLVKRDLQLFIKRLRKAYPDVKMRYFACGEYGEQFARPHYHMILFNCPDDFVKEKSVVHLDPLNFDADWSRLCSSSFLSVDSYYRSQSLESCGTLARSCEVMQTIWTHGHVMIGDCTFNSCAYVARYCLKKVNGDAADEHYQGKQPEFVLMSRRPGIGGNWYARYKDDVYPNDFMVIRGNKCKPPRYFDKLLEKENPDLFEQIKSKRAISSSNFDVEKSLERLAVKEELLNLKQQKISRKFEKNS